MVNSLENAILLCFCVLRREHHICASRHSGGGVQRRDLLCSTMDLAEFYEKVDNIPSFRPVLLIIWQVYDTVRLVPQGKVTSYGTRGAN